MKNILKLAALAAVLVACNDENVKPGINDQINDITEIASSGEWIITYYFDDTDETDHYTGYTFDFASDGTLTATKGTTTVNGTWSVTLDDDSDDDNPTSDDIDFNIFFAAPADFNELSDDWDIKSRTANKIELIDVSGGNGGTDLLTFERN